MWKHKKKVSLEDAMTRSPLMMAVMGILVFSAGIVVLTLPEKVDVETFNRLDLGQFMPRDVRAKCEFRSVDAEKTTNAKKEAAEEVPFYFRLKPEADSAILNRFRLFFGELKRRAAESRQGKTYDLEQADPAMYKEVSNMSETVFKYCARLEENEQGLQSFYEKVQTRILNRGILDKKTDPALEMNPDHPVCLIHQDGRISRVDNKTKLLTGQQAAREAALLLRPEYLIRTQKEKTDFEQQLTRMFLPFFQGGNLEKDEKMRQDRQEEARNSVKARRRTVREGDIIVRKNTKLQEEHKLLLKDYTEALAKEKRADTVLCHFAVKAMLCLTFLIFAIIYIVYIHPDAVRSNRTVWLLGAIAILCMMLNRLFAGAFQLFCGIADFPLRLIFIAIPLGLPAILISAIYGLRLAICVGLFVAGISAVALNNSFPVVIYGLLISGLAACWVHYVSSIKRFGFYSFMACFISSVFANLIFQLGSEWDLTLFSYGILVAFFMSLVTTMLALIVLFLLDACIDVSTNMTYMEYTNHNHPLLKWLQEEAPGTYHHSERVASIAERAAREINANPIQLQACALFHDIGKLSAPEMFTENNKGANPLKNLPPEESAAIIRRHVTYGLELAKKYKLKRPLRDAIVQHHGTDFISFFYDQAKSQSDTPPDEAVFRYPGPIPCRKETVILSLADCAEAISQSMPQPIQPDLLRQKLLDLFLRKMNNGQFHDAPVTIAELNTILDSFVDSLTVMGQGRIAYPSFKKEKK